MNEFFNNLKNEARKEKLSQNEKQYMRMALYDAMKRSPVYVTEEVQVISTRRIKSSYVWFSPQFAMPVIAFLIVGLGAGTAFASQGALPGDALYAVKINVTEPAVGALAISDEAKAEWHAQVAQTRLEEAEKLAVAGKLDATTSAQIAANFDEHRSAAQTLAQKVENEDPGSGADLEAQFDSSLDAHDAILARVGDNGSTSGEYAHEVAAHVRENGKFTLALAVADTEDSYAGDLSNQDSNQAQGNATDTATVRTMAFSASAPVISTSSASSTTITASATLKAAKTIAPTSGTLKVTATAMPASASQTKALLKLQKSAKSALSDAQDAFGDVKKSLDASTTLKINTEFSRIGAIVNATSSTSASLTGALKDATVLKAFLKASKNLKVNFFSHENSNSNSDSRSNKGSDGKGKGDNGSTVSTTSADVSVSAQTSVSITPSDNSGDGSDDSGKDRSSSSGKGSGDNNDDSFVTHLLSHF